MCSMHVDRKTGHKEYWDSALHHGPVLNHPLGLKITYRGKEVMQKVWMHLFLRVIFNSVYTGMFEIKHGATCVGMDFWCNVEEHSIVILKPV